MESDVLSLNERKAQVVRDLREIARTMIRCAEVYGAEPPKTAVEIISTPIEQLLYSQYRGPLSERRIHHLRQIIDDELQESIEKHFGTRGDQASETDQIEVGQGYTNQN